ncbi:hypothetical protein NFI96_017553 [Prochilodus magdalenae]|nr:hypothetical protein NFI96_017553 [Prochilodus magdalenae]
MPAGSNRSDCTRCGVSGAPPHHSHPPPPPLALFPLPALVAVTVACAVLFVVGVAGNLTTIVVVSRYRDMRTTTNLYLRSMALSDLLVFACMPLDLQRVWRYRPWPLGGAVCKLFHFVSECCTHCTALSIAALSVHRYLAVRFPLRAKVAVTRRRVRAVILALWAVSACSAGPVLALVGVEHEYEHEHYEGENDTESWSGNWTWSAWSASPTEAECTATRHAVKSGLLSAVVCVSGALVALPALCLCVLYTLIGRKLSRGSRTDAHSSARDKNHRQSVKLLGEKNRGRERESGGPVLKQGTQDSVQGREPGSISRTRVRNTGVENICVPVRWESISSSNTGKTIKAKITVSGSICNERQCEHFVMLQ